MANHLLNLAQEKVPTNCHFHLDENNSLEKGSTELIIQKK
ncbi:Imm32 family immunity protein [Parachlamydia acanthamoebae]